MERLRTLREHGILVVVVVLTVVVMYVCANARW